MQNLEVKPKTIKHSGARWVSIYFKMSDFGVKVANVLGQVGLGIYHYADDIQGKRKPEWTNGDRISVVLPRELATFDGCELTMLFLCCQSAGISFELLGRWKNLIEIRFLNQPLPSIENTEYCFTSIRDFVAANGISRDIGYDLILKRDRYENERWQYWDAETKQTANIEFSIKNSKPLNYEQIIRSAHESCIRVAIGGLSRQSMRIQLSRRSSRDGFMCSRHPTWEKHKEILASYTTIDFTKLD